MSSTTVTVSIFMLNRCVVENRTSGVNILVLIMKIIWFVCILFTENIQYGKSQYYQLPVDQNSSSLPLPYQTVLGLNHAPEVNQQFQGFPQRNVPPPYPYPFNYPMPPINQPDMNSYYALLAQQGRGVYQYPAMGYGGYPAYPQPYIPQGLGYPQMGPGYPGMGYPHQNNMAMGGNYNAKTEILDVSPEYQRQLLGWPAEGSSTSGQGVALSKPGYTVDIDTHTTNNTVIPANLSKPIISEKKFVTSIKRTFVYDSSKPENIKPINIHIINGQQVTTTPPPTTTVNEDVQGLTTSTVKPSGRRFMDVPKSCPKGTSMAQNGECIAPFAFRTPNKTIIVRNETEESEI